MAEPEQDSDKAEIALARLHVKSKEDLRRAWEEGLKSGQSKPVRRGEAKARLRRRLGVETAET